MSHRFDATLKEIFTPAPEDFAHAFGLPLVRPARTLNVDLSTLSAATDVALGFGDPLQEIVDLNFQSGPDSKVASRCHLYNAALHFRFGVPVRTLLVLLRPKADSAELNGNLAYACGASAVEFRYELVRLWQQPNEPFLRGGVQLLPLATLCKLPSERPLLEGLREVVREIDRRLADECEHAQAVRLMTAAFVLAGLRTPLETLGPVFEGVRVMHESTAFDYYVEQGALKGVRHVLLRLGQKRFGPPDKAAVDTLNEINDLDRLERLGDAIFSVASWQELLATA